MNKAVFLSPLPEQDTPEQPQGEARMREALGLRADGSRVPGHHPRSDRGSDHMQGAHRRHRFVQEGEVPVEMVTLREHGGRPPANRQQRADDPTVAAGKLAREQAERALQEVQDRCRELQTKLAHAELARDEALALAARRQSQIDILLAQPPAPPPASQAPAPQAPAPQAPAPQAPPLAPLLSPSPAPVALPLLVGLPEPELVMVAKPPRKPRAKAEPRVKEPKPVKWWIKPAVKA